MDMKHFIHYLIAGVVLAISSSCQSLKPVNYANREWHISNYYGQIIDKDTTYRMTFGDVLIPEELAIISCADSAALHPGMERFIADILKTTGLTDDEVLFYVPYHGKMFVKLNNEPPAIRPSSLTAGMHYLTLNKENEQPYTMWIYPDDVEDWHRKSDEMYTYIYFNKKKQQVLVVDFYDYGDTPIAQISVMQSRNKMTDKMKLPTEPQFKGYYYHQLKDYIRDIEFWSHQIDWRRQNAFSNYKIGQEQDRQKFNGPKLISQADSALFSNDPYCALKYYKRYLKYAENPSNNDIFNAACAASLSHDIDYGMYLLNTLASRDSLWYYKDPIDPDLNNLKEAEEWESFNEMISKRRNNIEKNYNIPLRQRLTQIRRSDQDVRNRFLAIYKSEHPDSILINNLLTEMRSVDEKNLIEVESILDEYGWPGKDQVGDECIAIWMVIQHSPIETQKQALPMLKTAASKGDLNPVNIAMLEDRILVNSGQKQIYGTQFYYSDDEGRKRRILFPIEDIDNIDKRRIAIGLKPLKEDYPDIDIESI